VKVPDKSLAILEQLVPLIVRSSQEETTVLMPGARNEEESRGEGNIKA